MSNLFLLKWTEEIAGKVENIVGIKMPFRRRELRIVARSPFVRQEGRSDLSREDKAASGLVTTDQEVVGRKIVQRLTVYNHENVDREDAEQALCSLLLDGYVTDIQIETGESVQEGARKSDITPLWLSQGLAQNLDSVLKGRNVRNVLGRWEKGRVVPLGEIVRSKPGDRNYPDKSLCGLLVAWILSLPNRTECFHRIFERLAEGKDISPEWFASCIDGCGSDTDLENRWNNWICRQKRVVYEPGLVTGCLINELRAELLLYPGGFGIPSSGKLGQRIHLRDLIKEREARWLPAFCDSKRAALRILAAGRGEEFADVVDSYCRFLVALGKRKSRRSLERLVRKAEQKLKELEKTVKHRLAGSQRVER